MKTEIECDESNYRSVDKNDNNYKNMHSYELNNFKRMLIK